MCRRNRIALCAIALLALPATSQALPISYSFTGELTSFSSNVGGVERTLESLSSRTVTGLVEYDTDRQDVTEISGLLRMTISGDGFFFDAGDAGIEGAQSIYRNDTAALDSINFFEFYEYMLAESVDTRTTNIELFGSALLNPGIGTVNSIINASNFEYGSGLFGSTSWDYGETVTGLSGAFDITSLRSADTSIPEPGTAALLVAGLLLLTLGTQRPGFRFHGSQLSPKRQGFTAHCASSMS